MPSTKEYFDGLRSSYNIEECTKKDVCLLMRQLDAHFYTRARKGQLVAYDEPPQMSWVHNGRCEKNSRSIKLAPVTKLHACKAAVRAKGISKVKKVEDSTLPSGCSIRNGRGYLNALRTNVEADVSYESSNPDKPWARTTKTEIIQYCQVDYSLNEAAASYYSPYKLKQNMRDRPQMSTSCSFGMMANLSRLELTDSPCAEILSFRPHYTAAYPQAADALQAAERMEAAGKQEDADAIRTEVEQVRSKFILIQLITNDWCPAIWREAMEQDATCSAPRFPSWAANDFVHEMGIGEEDLAERAEYLVRGISGDTKQALMQSRTPKMGLPEGFCNHVSDMELDDVLDQVSSSFPPDFFAHLEHGTH